MAIEYGYHVLDKNSPTLVVKSADAHKECTCGCKKKILQLERRVKRLEEMLQEKEGAIVSLKRKHRQTTAELIELQLQKLQVNLSEKDSLLSSLEFKLKHFIEQSTAERKQMLSRAEALRIERNQLAKQLKEKVGERFSLFKIDSDHMLEGQYEEYSKDQVHSTPYCQAHVDPHHANSDLGEEMDSTPYQQVRTEAAHHSERHHVHSDLEQEEEEDMESTPNVCNSNGNKRLHLDMDEENSTTSPDEVASPKTVQLVEGYGVYIVKRQLDEAIARSCDIPTRLLRNLLMVFFTPTVLGQSSCFGTRKFSALNADIIGAIFRYVQSKHSVSRNVLVDAVNDKCANYRRKKKPSATDLQKSTIDLLQQTS